MKTKANDTANPITRYEVQRIHGQDNDVPVLRGGLTKREYFAAMAMQGMAAFGDSKESYATSEIPKWAVKMADDLIKALNESQGK